MRELRAARCPAVHCGHAGHTLLDEQPPPGGQSPNDAASLPERQPIMCEEIRLRPVEEHDIALFCAQQMDAEAIHMAAFTPAQPLDAAAFATRWARLRGDPTIVVRTIVVQGKVAGHIARYVEAGEHEVTYWLDRAFWGRGVATCALALFVGEVRERPLFARVAADNLASLTVLQRCGFVVYGEALSYAEARGCEIAELLLRLDAPPPPEAQPL